MKKLTTIIFLSTLMSCGSSEKKGQAETIRPSTMEEIVETKDTNHVTIFVQGDTTVLLNDRLSNLKEIEASLSKLKANKGSVYYSRDNQQLDPPEIAIQVMDLVAASELPVQFYTDQTFTHVVSF